LGVLDRMLELRNMLNIKECSEKLRSENVWKRKSFWGGPKLISYPPPQPVIARHGPGDQSWQSTPPTRSCWIHPCSYFRNGLSYLCALWLQSQISKLKG
jgi:hypothetical protein